MMKKPQRKMFERNRTVCCNAALLLLFQCHVFHIAIGCFEFELRIYLLNIPVSAHGTYQLDMYVYLYHVCVRNAIMNASAQKREKKKEKKSENKNTKRRTEIG